MLYVRHTAAQEVGFQHALGAQQLRQHCRPRLSQQQSLQPCVACSRDPQEACCVKKEGWVVRHRHTRSGTTAQRGRHQETRLSPDCTTRAMSSVAAACCRVCGHGWGAACTRGRGQSGVSGLQWRSRAARTRALTTSSGFTSITDTHAAPAAATTL